MKDSTSEPGMTDISTGFILQQEIGPDIQDNILPRNNLSILWLSTAKHSFQIRTFANLITFNQLGLLLRK